MKDKNTPVSSEEQDQTSRILLAWLNQYPQKPVDRIRFEYLSELSGMALSTIQTALKTDEDIIGNYVAQYQFKIVYRTHPADDNERLQADEMLNQFGAWATSRKDKPVLGPNVSNVSIERNSPASLFARYDGGAEDHQVLMSMTYEVSV